MSQFALPGFQPTPEPPQRPKDLSLSTDRSKPLKKFGGLKDRLFLGIGLDAQAAYSARQAAWTLRTRHHLKSWPRRKSLLHVSLRHIGDFNGFPGGLVEKVTSFRHCIVLAGDEGVVDVRRLENEIGEVLERGRIREPSRHFSPHVTLMYDQTVIPTERLRQPVRWKVEEFVLIHSLLGESRHVVLQTFPLDGGCRRFTHWQSP